MKKQKIEKIDISKLIGTAVKKEIQASFNTAVWEKLNELISAYNGEGKKKKNKKRTFTTICKNKTDGNDVAYISKRGFVYRDKK